MNPNWKRIVREHLAVLRLPPEREIEIVEEQALHLEAAYEDALAGGLSEAEAETRAAQSYDWRLLECELSRAERAPDARAWRPSLELIERKGGMRMEWFIQDLRFGVRMLVKNPGFTLIAVLTLALGIGVNTAIFSVVSAVLLRPLPYSEPDKLVMVWERRIREGSDNNAVAPADFRDWRARNQVFANMAAMFAIPLNLSEGNEPERVTTGLVSASFFEVLGVKPMLGRGFSAEEEQAGRSRVVIMNHDLWQRRFGADRNIVGRRISIDGAPFEVVGVLPPSFRFPNKELALWVPLDANAQDMQTRLSHFLSVYARLKPGVTLEQARADMERIGAQLSQEYPQENENHTAFVIPLREEVARNLGAPLMILFAAVGLVLLIACANVANLQLIRAVARQKELAVRAALGAVRWRIARQLLTENAMLAALGAVLGMLLAWWSVGTFTSLLPRNILHLTGAPLDLRVLGFTIAISLLTGALSSLAALLHASSVKLNDTLKEGGRGAGAMRQRARSAVVVVELALAIVLLIGAGLLIRSFWKLQRVSPGFAPQNVLTAQIALPSARYRDPEQRVRFFQQLSEQARALPGVQAVGAISILPLGGGWSRTSIAIEGRAEMTDLLPQLRPRIHPRTVTPDYFQALGIPLLNGRFLTPKDDSNAPLVALINQTAAQRYWPGQNPLGHRVQIGGGAPWREVIGIVGDVKDQGLGQEINPEVYFAWAQDPQRDGTLVVRGQNVASLAPALRNQVHQLDKDLPLSNLRLLEEVVEDSIAAPRSYALLLALFAGIALTLATIGIYGVMAYGVSQRTHELGVRLALGAQTRDALLLVMRQGLRMTSLGVALGLAAAWGLTRWMKNMLFEVSATDPLTVVFVTGFLVGVALLACYLPARRATKVDPLTALRHE
jgi:putative ABC transport system permease protein